MNQGNASFNQNPPGMLDQGEQKDEDDFNWKCSCWFFQVIDWILLLILIIVIILSSDFIVIMSLAFGIFHFLYILVEILCPTGKYICHKISGEGIHEKMGRYFRTAPIIKFHLEWYHYLEKKNIKTDKSGRVDLSIKAKKEVSSREDYEMPYYSERDVSGLFYLNFDKAIAKKKVYIKLKIKEEINFADAISIIDYHKEIDNFYERKKDVYLDYKEERFVPDLIHHNLISLGKNEPFLSKYFFFILSTLLTLSELYKLYFDSLCISQIFKIRKLISTRYDLNQPKYEQFIPQIIIINQTYNYQPQDYNYLNPSDKYSVNLPTKEEIERAKQYQDKVPDYQVSSGKGDIHEGVIIDNPNFSSYKANPRNQKPAPTIFNQNNKHNGLSISVKVNQNNKVENNDAETDDSLKPYLSERTRQSDFNLQTQIQ